MSINYSGYIDYSDYIDYSNYNYYSRSFFTKFITCWAIAFMPAWLG